MNHAMLALLGMMSLGTCDVPKTCYDHPAITYKIAHREGYYLNGSLPNRLHNPGAIVFACQRNATRGSKGFAKFATVEAGWEALDRDVTLKVRRGINLKKGWKYL